RSRMPVLYDATVVLRVTESQVAIPGAQLGAGVLRSYLNDMAFTNMRLLELMRGHRRYFGDVDEDPMDSLEGFRQQLSLTTTENDFIEERGPGDPARSARVVITFHAVDPQVALGVARELAELVKGSTLGRQKESLERERVAALAAATKADADVVEL